jgi:hypothetical protein
MCDIKQKKDAPSLQMDSLPIACPMCVVSVTMKFQGSAAQIAFHSNPLLVLVNPFHYQLLDHGMAIAE